MRAIRPLLVLLLGCGDTDTDTDTGADDTDTDTEDTEPAETDDPPGAPDTDGDTDDEDPRGFSYSYDFDTPSTSSTTAGWEGWSATSNTDGSFGVGTSTALDVRGGFSGQVGYLGLAPTGGSAASITLRAGTTWQAPGPGYSVQAMVVVGQSVALAAGDLTMTLRAGDDTRATGSVASSAYSVAGQINQPLMVSYTTTADDTGRSFAVEIGASANCCAEVQHFLESFTWTATPPAN